MPKVSVKSSSSLPPRDVFAKIRNLLENDKDLRKLDSAYKCEFDESTFKGSAKGNQFKANMTVAPNGAGSEVEIVVDLPLALTLVKGMIQKTLQKKLDGVLST